MLFFIWRNMFSFLLSTLIFVNNLAGITLQTECIHNLGISCSACICVCFLRQSQCMYPPPPLTFACLNFYFKSYFHVTFKQRTQGHGDRAESKGLWGMTEQGRGKYQSKARCSWGLWSCCSEAPTSPWLLSAHQGQVPAYPPLEYASNGPGSLLSQTECRLLSQRRGSATAKFNTPEWKVNTPARDNQEREKTVKRSPGKQDLEKRQLVWDESAHAKAGSSQMMPGRQLMSRFTLFDPPCQFWCLTIKAKHLIFVFSTTYCKGYCFSCELWLVCTNPPPQQRRNDLLYSSNFPLFQPVAKIRHEKAWLHTPKDTEELFVLGLVLLHAIFNLGQKGREAAPLILDDMEALLHLSGTLSSRSSET